MFIFIGKTLLVSILMTILLTIVFRRLAKFFK